MRAWIPSVAATVVVTAAIAYAQQIEPRGKTSYAPVDITESFSAILARMKAAKPKVERAHNDLLAERYDLGNHPGSGVTMFRGKPVQSGVRVRLPKGATWESLAE